MILVPNRNFQPRTSSLCHDAYRHVFRTLFIVELVDTGYAAAPKSVRIHQSCSELTMPERSAANLIGSPLRSTTGMGPLWQGSFDIPAIALTLYGKYLPLW